MAAPSDQVNRAPDQDTEEDDIILLTEVVEEPPSEVVLEISGGEQELESLLKGAPSQTSQETTGLEDFLSSLEDLPEDLGTPAIPAASSEVSAPLKTEPQEGSATGEPAELMLTLSETELKELLREVAQETMEKLTHEMGEVLDRKIDAWRRRQPEKE